MNINKAMCIVANSKPEHSKGLHTAFAVPPYIHRQLRERAAVRHSSLRQIMLHAFQHIGVYVAPADLSIEERPARQASRGTQAAFALPLYVVIQLRALAIRQSCSMRYLMLAAIAAAGLHVEARDLIPDKRQRRPRGSRQHFAGNPRVKGGVLRFPRTPQSVSADPGR